MKITCPHCNASLDWTDNLSLGCKDNKERKQGMPLSVRMPADLYEKLDNFCARYYLDRPQAVRLALSVFFDAHQANGGLLPQEKAIPLDIADKNDSSRNN